jgi:hypothetical protein
MGAGHPSLMLGLLSLSSLSCSLSSGPDSSHPVTIVAHTVTPCYSPVSLSLSHWCPFIHSLSSVFSCSSRPDVIVSPSLSSPSIWSPSLQSASLLGPWWWCGGIVVAPTPCHHCSPFQWLTVVVGVSVVVVVVASLCHYNTVGSPRLMKTYVN